jgi:Phage tail sheath C-terminal domain
MPIEKFRFVSPGVQAQEVDQSQIPRTPEDMGPVIIGRSLRGPVMRPVKVGSFSDFVDVFGEPVAGGVGGDVWRNGNKTAPTYGAYAAQAYLRNSSPVTFIRLAGYENPDAQGGEAGWEAMDAAYGLFIAPIVSSSADVYSIPATTASLAAVIYANSGQYGLTGKPLSGSTESVSGLLGNWVRATGTNGEFKLVVGGVTKTVNFDENSKKYIRSVLNTNPILTNEDIVETEEKYFLGETFKTWVLENHPTLSGSSDFAAVLVKLNDGSADFANHKLQAEDASTGWVVSQHKGLATDFVANGTTGEYPVQKLFKLVGLTEGEWNSQNLKVAIEDIKEPPNAFVKYGSFTVSIRKMEDNDLVPQYVERFVNVSLDPSSENYIAKKIGDKYTEWDYEKKAFVEYGTYDNKSKFIRVEMNPDVDGGLTDPDLIPFGFYGPAQLADVAWTHASGSFAGTGFFSQTAISGNAAVTASFALQKLPLLSTTADSPAASMSSVVFGFKTNIENTKKYNKDIPDFLRAYPNGWTVEKPSFLFTLDDVSASVSSGSIVQSTPATWAEGKRAGSLSLTSQNLTSSNGSRLVLGTFNKFVMPLFGGSDGVSIFEKDPFNRRVLGQSGANEFTNYAYNSVKVAVESLADPEVVEMNLAAMPGIENEGLTGLLLEKCEVRGDALAVIDLKGDYVPDEGKPAFNTLASARKPVVADAVANLKNRAINSSYGCAFFPWVLIRDNLSNNTVWVPPSVAALGTFSSSQRKTEVWFAPAGFNRGGLTEGAAGLPVLQASAKLSSKDRDALYEANINPIASFPSEGIVIFGQKTLQVTPSALDRINVRRLMIYLKKEISRMATTVLFDPNIQVTWKRFTNQAVPFLESVKSRFGVSEFRVVLDETTTTPELVDRNIVYAKILLKPTRAIEFIALDFVITNTGASFND